MVKGNSPYYFELFIMSNLFNPLNFNPNELPCVPANPVNDDDLPEELDIFFRDEMYFLPEGKHFKDLTEAESKLLRAQYRFDCLKPGQYQSITGFGGMI